MVYRILSHKAKGWWWHIELRKRGQAQAARALERQDIRRCVKIIRSALRFEGICFAGENKYSLDYHSEGNRCWISGYDSADEGMPLCCRMVGIATCDYSGLGKTVITRSILGYEGIERVKFLVSEGATVYNLQEEPHGGE